MVIKMENLRDKKTNLLVMIFIMSMLVVISYVFVKFMKFNTELSKNNRNMFYLQVVNGTMPIMKEVHFEKEAMFENQFTTSNFLEFSFGYSLDNPKSIVDKEFLYTRVQNRIKPYETSIKEYTVGDDVVQKVEPDKGKNPELDATITTFDQRFVLDPSQPKPKVLIYHSHTGEAFKPYANSSRDNNQNIVAVGNAMAEELKRYGVNVIHDTTICDSPYPKAYSASRKVLQNNLDTYKDFDIIIDLHRDAVANKAAVTANLNGVNVARSMFVYDASTPNINQNLEIINNLQGIMNRTFPGVARSFYIYDSTSTRFNADLSQRAVLIEMGSEASTLGEAKNTALIIARTLAEHLKR